MAKAKNVMEQSAAELQLRAALAKVSELRDAVNVGKTNGISHAEIKLQETFLVLWKKGNLVLKKEDAKRLYESTTEKLRGKNIIHAKNHLNTLFSDIQGSSLSEEVKPKKTKSSGISENFVDAFGSPLVELSDTRSLNEVLGVSAGVTP